MFPVVGVILATLRHLIVDRPGVVDLAEKGRRRVLVTDLGHTVGVVDVSRVADVSIINLTRMALT